MGSSHMFISLTLIVVGLLLYLVACKLPINLLFGFRIGYTLMSKRLWVKYNRLSGLSLVLVGLISLILSTFITNTTLYTCIVLGLIIVSHILLAHMASREAEIELSFREVGDVRVEGRLKKIGSVAPSYPRLLLALFPPIISLIATLYFLPLLPEYVPVHYDVRGVPDRWEPLEDFLKITVPCIIGLQCTALIFMVIELKAPMIFYVPGLSKEEIVNLVYGVGIATAWILLLFYIDLLYYSTHSTHILPTLLQLIIAATIAAMIVAKLIVVWVKWKRIANRYLQRAFY